MTRARKSEMWIVILLILAGAAAWAAVDLWGPRSASLRQFDPDAVAWLETRMWRSYYDKTSLALFSDLAVLLRRQYHLPPLRSYLVAFRAAKAAFIFKDGTRRSDYERALPDLLDYYTAIRRVSDSPFDPARAARLELEWWIIHRERESYEPGSLDAALSALPAEIYQIPAGRFTEHAKYRAEAMILRDRMAETNDGVTEAGWQKINQLLVQSWRSLWNAVNN